MHRLAYAACLIVVVGLGWANSHFAAVGAYAGVEIALGLLLLTGTLLSELLEAVRLPHLTGYLLAGILVGPHVLGLVDAPTVAKLSPVNTLALAIIALAGGAELRIDQLRRGLRSLVIATGAHSLLGLALAVGSFFLIRELIPFTQGMVPSAALAVALLWGVLSVSRSPSATLGILSQTRARGPVASFTLAFVMSSDIVVVVLMALATLVARVLLDPNAALSFDAFRALGHEILGSVSIGTTLGLALIAYLRLVGKQLLVVFLAIGFGASEVLHYLSFDPLLTFLIAGFIVQNMSRQGETFLHALEGMGSTVYVVFFATAGADLDIPLLAELWKVAIVLALVRGLGTVVAARVSSKLARDEATLARWSWTGLIAQAGLTQGLAGAVARDFPTFGPPFRALVIATLAINAVVGPILFKLALDRARESKEATLLADEEGEGAPAQ
jgi:Kef-type K+ transport system membrane component KefB